MDFIEYQYRKEPYERRNYNDGPKETLRLLIFFGYSMKFLKESFLRDLFHHRYIYALADMSFDDESDIEKYFYVGQSNDPEHRVKGHLSPNAVAGDRMADILEREERDNKKYLKICTICMFNNAEDTNMAEKYWIWKFLKAGAPLLNLGDRIRDDEVGRALEKHLYGKYPDMPMIGVIDLNDLEMSSLEKGWIQSTKYSNVKKPQGPPVHYVGNVRQGGRNYRESLEHYIEK